MSQEEQVKLVSVFFYLSLAQEELTVRATLKTLHALDSERSKKTWMASDINPLIVRMTNKVLNSLSAHIGQSPREASCVFPKDINLGTWRKFRKKAQRDEFMVVLWSKVLKLNDHDIATGLCLSEGTVRHRLGRGLRVLGSCIN